ncbi:hypothetical protein VR46_34805 [Streptomyces sp. NRRL S-444]|nr:hypothetical protein VR46_34805 [Streptomyces sp. NRRL S-444]
MWTWFYQVHGETADGSVNRTVAEAVSLGAKVDNEPRNTTYGLVFARLIDPRGNRIGLFSLPQD